MSRHSIPYHHICLQRQQNVYILEMKVIWKTLLNIFHAICFDYILAPASVPPRFYPLLSFRYVCFNLNNQVAIDDKNLQPYFISLMNTNNEMPGEHYNGSSCFLPSASRYLKEEKPGHIHHRAPYPRVSPQFSCHSKEPSQVLIAWWSHREGQRAMPAGSLSQVLSLESSSGFEA